MLEATTGSNPKRVSRSCFPRGTSGSLNDEMQIDVRFYTLLLGKWYKLNTGIERDGKTTQLFVAGENGAIRQKRAVPDVNGTMRRKKTTLELAWTTGHGAI